MSSMHAAPASSSEDALVTAALAGDESAFATLTERYRRELQVHCYRMLGSLQDAEDVVQETFLRAWRRRTTLRGAASFRAWLYRIATNACLDALRRQPRRVLPAGVAPPADPTVEPMPGTDLPWLQPYPDRLAPIASEARPEPAFAEKETIELAFLAAIQHLPPRQRAVLILRDALGWSAGETAALLDTSVAAVNSALQRARATLKRQLPARHVDWAPASDPDAEERRLVRRYVEAWERADVAGLVALLREDARMTMPPTVSWYDGRAAIETFFASHVFGPSSPGHFRLVSTRANGQPAVAMYLRREGQAEKEHRAFGVMMLGIEDGAVGAITLFALPELFDRFGLEPTIP